MPPVRLPAPAAALCAFLACGALAPAPLHAQLAVTANAGTVRYEQATSEQSAALNPEFRIEGRHAAFAATAAFTEGSDGSRILAGGPSLWLATSPIVRHVQLDAQGAFQYTSPRGDSTSYAALGLGEIAFTSDGPGLALGAGGGMGKIAGTPSITAFKTRVRAWFDAGPVSVALAAEPTRIEGSWYTDYGAEADASSGHFEGALTAKLRQSHLTGTSAGGELETAWHLTPALALQLSGGRYLRDPFQGLPAGNFLTLGLKFLLWRPHETGGQGVSESALDEVDFGSAGSLFAHGGGNSLLHTRTVPSTGKGNSTTSGGGSTFGRGHKP